MNKHVTDGTVPAEIMLVDDTPSSLLLLAGILTKNGFRVRKADSGEVALASIRIKVPDLVLLDVMMPGLDGFEVCRILMSSPDTEKIPVIFLTALNDIKDKISGFGAGGADFITKPFQMEEVLLRVNRQLETLYLRRELSRDITERKRAEETLRQRLMEMEAIHTVTTALRTAKTRDEALPIIMDETLTALGTSTGAIYLYHPGKNELVSAIARGWFEQFSELPLKPGEGIVGKVFSSGRSHLTKDFRNDPEVRHIVAPEGWGGVCLPIHADKVMVGTMVIALPHPRIITPEQVALLESLAEIAGAALHRMNLYEETVRQLERLEALHSIDIAITANMDLQMTLNLLLDQVKTQLDVDAAEVLLFNPHAQALEYAVGRGFHTQLAQTRVRLGGDFAGRAALERRTIQVEDSANIRMSPQFAAFWAGEGFRTYFGVPLIAKGQVKGVLEVYHRTPFHPEPDWVRFLGMLAGQAAIAIDSVQLFENLQRSNAELALAYDTTIEGWSRALDLRDKETEGHTLRVTEMTLRLEKAMGISDSELVNVRWGTLLHDIGKMGIPDEILLKAGELSEKEWVLMRKHPQLAFDLLSPISYLKAALDIPYCHHEKWDGSGYPRGLKGEQIPLVARIFAIVDVWDALRSDRPYRSAWDERSVVEHIKSLSGTHFDPQVVKMFLESDLIGKSH